MMEQVNRWFRSCGVGRWRAAWWVVRCLRNYVQHRNLPVGSIGYPSNWIEQLTPRARRRHRVQVFLDTEALGEGDSFKLGVLRELRSPGDRYVPMTPMVRQYIDCFGRPTDDCMLDDDTEELSSRR